MSQNPFYVYVLKDPRGKPAKPFYISKGTGNLTEHRALKIAAELISAFGKRSYGGLLTNRVKPNPENVSKHIKINIPEGCYEKSQMALDLLKSAVMELAKANSMGIKNSDAAKYIGLQSDYGGRIKRLLEL